MDSQQIAKASLGQLADLLEQGEFYSFSALTFCDIADRLREIEDEAKSARPICEPPQSTGRVLPKEERASRERMLAAARDAERSGTDDDVDPFGLDDGAPRSTVKAVDATIQRGPTEAEMQARSRAYMAEALATPDEIEPPAATLVGATASIRPDVLATLAEDVGAIKAERAQAEADKEAAKEAKRSKKTKTKAKPVDVPASVVEPEPFQAAPLLEVSFIDAQIGADRIAAESKPKRERKAKGGRLEVTPAFDAVWRVMPRKVGKALAFDRWQRIPEADHDLVLFAAQRYAKEKQGEDEKFIQHASAWFNQRKWEDYREKFEGGASAAPHPAAPTIATYVEAESTEQLVDVLASGKLPDPKPSPVKHTPIVGEPDFASMPYPKSLNAFMGHALKRSSAINVEKDEILEPAGSPIARRELLREVWRYRLITWIVVGTWPPSWRSPLDAGRSGFPDMTERFLALAADLGRTKNGRYVDGTPINEDGFRRALEIW